MDDGNDVEDNGDDVEDNGDSDENAVGRDGQSGLGIEKMCFVVRVID